MEDSYRGPQACQLIGITYRQLDYWSRIDLVKPSIETLGSGRPRGYSYDDLVKLSVIKHLLDAGVSLERARLAINADWTGCDTFSLETGIVSTHVSLAAINADLHSKIAELAT